MLLRWLAVVFKGLRIARHQAFSRKVVWVGNAVGLGGRKREEHGHFWYIDTRLETIHGCRVLLNPVSTGFTPTNTPFSIMLVPKFLKMSKKFGEFFQGFDQLLANHTLLW